jgi:septum formation protein
MTALAEIDLLLASTSRYRRELLTRLTTRFRAVPPRVDETPRAGEVPARLAARLAEEKARDVAAQAPGLLVIGSDQVADLDGRLLGKAGSVEAAKSQLAACSEREVVFHTAVCVIDARTTTAAGYAAIDTTRVKFRRLEADEIMRYVERDRPLDCAGSFKVESTGIALFERVDSQDPTALIGLPLIALCGLLREAGISVV